VTRLLAGAATDDESDLARLLEPRVIVLVSERIPSAERATTVHVPGAKRSNRKLPSAPLAVVRVAPLSSERACT
jgi:hypothetical protein